MRFSHFYGCYVEILPTDRARATNLSLTEKVKHFGSSTLIVIITIGLVALIAVLSDLSRLWQNEVIDLSGSIGLGNLIALALGLDSTKAVDAASSLLVLILIISIFYKNYGQRQRFIQN